MRLFLVVLALAACHHAAGPSTSTPTNKAPEPDYRTPYGDELAFLPVDSDFVIGFDFATLRNSPMWALFKPQIDAIAHKVPKVGGACGAAILTFERVTMALKMQARDQLSGVVVMQGGDMNRALECTVSEARKKGETVTVDRGATITTSPA